MLSKTYIQKIKKEYLDYAEKRRDIIKFAGDGLHCAKRAIFAMHRGENKEALARLAEVEKILKKLNKDFAGQSELFDEGSYRAALEEYVEAKLFCEFVTSGKMSEITSIPVDSDVFLAGLCDVPGELYRYAVNSATKRDFTKVKECKITAEEIIGELMEFDLTSYLRNKFDQAKGALNKIEQIVYEVSLKN